MAATTPATTPATDSLDTAEMAAQLRLGATRLVRVLRQQSDTGLTLTQLSTLATIGRHGPLTLGALAQHERVAPPSITRVVTKLEADGLIARTTDPDDRRSSLVVATRTGKALLTRSRQRRDAWLADRIDELPPADRARLADALDVLEGLTDREYL